MSNEQQTIGMSYRPNMIGTSTRPKKTNTGVVCSKPEETNPNIRYTNPKTSVSSEVISGNVDKRVALTAAPKTYLRDESIFANKVIQVLGREYYKGGTDISWMLSGYKFYGLLRNALGSTSGLIFPYTPRVSFNHKVNYQSQDITHTNITHHYYQNTSTPSISIEAKFTADNRSNALHMLSAIWYLTACSKCDFGMNTSTPGLPPPILYLSGYDTTIDNIPVLIDTIGYNYPDDKHYVNLVLDMTVPYNGNPDLPMTPTDSNGSFLQEYKKETKVDREKYAYGIDDFAFDMSRKKDEDGNEYGFMTFFTSSSTRWRLDKKLTNEGGVQLSFWLPTEMSINIGLLVQPNVLKEQKQWTLDGYKSGLLMTNRGKNPSVVSSSSQVPIMGTDAQGNSVQCGSKEVNEFHKFIPHGWTW
jgi:hypothetical protein